MTAAFWTRQKSAGLLAGGAHQPTKRAARPLQVPRGGSDASPAARPVERDPGRNGGGMIVLEGLPMPPSVNALFANRKQKGKKGRVPTKRYRAWLRSATMWARMQHPAPIGGAVHVTFYFCRAETKADPDNLLKAPMDLLVKLGLIRDDGPSVVLEGRWVWSDARGLGITVNPVLTP